MRPKTPRPAPATLPTLLTYEQAAEVLMVSAATVRRLVARGKIRGYAITRGCHRVDSDSLHDYLRMSRIQGVFVTEQPGKLTKQAQHAAAGTGLSVHEAVLQAKRRIKEEKRRREQERGRGAER